MTEGETTRTPRKGEKLFQGIGVSPGIARAKVRVHGEQFAAPLSRTVGVDDAEAETNLLNLALDRTRLELTELKDQIDREAGREQGMVFEAHLMMLDDRTVLDEVRSRLSDENESADSAYYQVIRRYLDSLRNIADPYLRERAVDIEDVARRVMRNIEIVRVESRGAISKGADGSPLRDSPGGETPADVEDATERDKNSTQYVLVSHDLTPSDTASMDRQRVMGFATEVGSPTSHTAILSRSLGIPAVVGAHGLLAELRNGDDLLIDGYSGTVILSPNDQTLYEYDKLEQSKVALRDDLQKLAASDTRTADGRRITLSGNVEFIDELEALRATGAEGVGLYRTEFFYVSEEELRSEDRQAEIYSEVARQVSPHEVIIRTLDVGGDKLMPELHQDPEPNPFLGWRGIRVSLAEPELFKNQLRAILRASAAGSVGIMYPFISSVGEVLQANELLEEAKAELRAKEIDYDEDIQVGAMIEIPSAALLADAIAAEVNFLSIGTNDLVQYTLAVDRVNERVANCYQPANPAVIHLMRQTIEAAHRADIWAGVCGEVAGDLLMTPLMVGMEVDELSVGVNQLLGVRRAISRLDTEACRQLLGEVMECSRTADVEKLCSAMARENYPELL
jgi:phosphotransferase system enzyme I (PtsI)